MGPKPSLAPFTVLFVGRVTPSKAQADLVDAFAAFRTAYGRPCRLVLVGRYDGEVDTGYAGEIRRRALSHGIASLVHMTGLISDAELNEWYHTADLYVSLSNHEGFGVPLVEAMAHGVPVLAWPAGAVPYTLDGAGELLTNRAPEAIAAAMLNLAREPERRARIAMRQRERLARFQLNRQMPALLSALALAGVVPLKPDEGRKLLAANINFTITGHVKGTYSLATINRAIALALEATLPNRVRFLPIEGQPTTDVSGVPPEHIAAITEFLARPKPPTGPTVVISQHYPPYVPAERGDLCLALFAWEESLVPPALISTLNSGFHAVLAMSQFVKKALIDSGIRIPVIVSGLPPELDRFFAISDERARLKRLSRLPFTFLHISSCFDRKGVDALLAAFAQEFRRGDPVRLIIKGFPNPHNNVAEQLTHLQHANSDLPEIILIDQDMNQDALLDLYKNADAMVLPTRGEGFNMPAAEAMAAGIPLIVTANGGQLDFCTSKEARLVKYRFDYSRTHLALPYSTWLEPDLNDLAAAMREVFKARAQAESEVEGRITKARIAVSERLDPARWAQNMVKVALDIVLAPPSRPMRLGWVSSWDVPCGVASYSDFLLGPMLSKDKELAARTVILTDDRTRESQFENGLRVRPCWRLGDPDVQALASAVASEDLDVLVLQHQPGLISWKGIVSLLTDARLQHRHVIITLHAVIRLMDISPEDRQETLLALSKASRIIVHTLTDLNFLKDQGLIDTVTLIPHAAESASVTPVPRSLPPTAEPIIGCYGFFVPGKGIPRLIEAAALLRSDWPKLRLLLVNSEYPIPESATEIAECRALASRLGLQDAIEWRTNFLANAESKSLLRATDLIVLPYEESKESASGAVRVALSSGIPVATTPIRLFAELRDAVASIPGFDAPALALGIRKLLADTEARSRVQRSAAEWLSENSWESVAERLHGMMAGLHATAPHRQERFPWQQNRC
jgi:glycosyltransferase involved in cell wall biosynthesis